MAGGVVQDKSKEFALRIIKLYKHLCNNKKEYVMSKQLLRCGTSIGANICEADSSMSKKEFISKMNISLKEAAESEYWIELLFRSEYLIQSEYDSIIRECREIKALLISIIRTSNQNIKK